MTLVLEVGSSSWNTTKPRSVGQLVPGRVCVCEPKELSARVWLSARQV